MANFFHIIKRKHATWVVAVLLATLVGGTGVLYWQGVVALGGLIFVVLMAFLLGAAAVLGETVAQRDGFLDGYRKGRNHH